MCLPDGGSVVKGYVFKCSLRPGHSSIENGKSLCCNKLKNETPRGCRLLVMFSLMCHSSVVVYKNKYLGQFWSNCDEILFTCSVSVFLVFRVQSTPPPNHQKWQLMTSSDRAWANLVLLSVSNIGGGVVWRVASDLEPQSSLAAWDLALRGHSSVYGAGL